MSTTTETVTLWWVACEDGRRRHALPFETRREADHWAQWGHLCTAKHTYTSTEHEESTMPEHTIMGFQAHTVVRAREVNERLKAATSPADAVEILRDEPYAVFQFIDEKSGYFGADGYHDGYRHLRVARNDPDSGLFDALGF